MPKIVDITIREFTRKFVETIKRKKNVKLKVKTLQLHLLFNTLQVFFKEYRQVFSNSLLPFKKTGLINIILLKINFCIQEISSFSYLLFDSSPAKKREKKTRNPFVHASLHWGESGAPQLLQNIESVCKISYLKSGISHDLTRICKMEPHSQSLCNSQCMI